MNLRILWKGARNFLKAKKCNNLWWPSQSPDLKRVEQLFSHHIQRDWQTSGDCSGCSEDRAKHLKGANSEFGVHVHDFRRQADIGCKGFSPKDQKLGLYWQLYKLVHLTPPNSWFNYRFAKQMDAALQTICWPKTLVTPLRNSKINRNDAESGGNNMGMQQKFE